MEWLTTLILITTVQYISPGSYGFPQPFNLPDSDYNLDGNAYQQANEDNSIAREVAGEEDTKLDYLSEILERILMHPWPQNGMPIVYVEQQEKQDDNDKDSEPDLLIKRDYYSPYATPNKRSRYYRKYPWKRQNSRQTYEPDNRYLCQPSKDDVFRLLVALHDARRGNKGTTINFCNRKRPASAIFTNIRFLGRRRK